MFKNFSLVLIVAVLMPFKMYAEWVTVNHDKKVSIPPEVTIISESNSSTVLKIDLSGFEIGNFLTDEETYQKVDLLTEIFTNEVGSPQLPHIAKILAIPDNSSISFEVIETGDIQIFKNVIVPPARLSWMEGQPESPYSENVDTYLSNEVYPKNYVKIDPPSVFRDFRIARVSVFPIRYIPADQELQVVSSITVKINYGSGEVVNPKKSPRRGIAPSFAKLYRSFIFNYEYVLQTLYDGKETEREVMLCIMPDEFFDSFQIYADWNRQSGTDIHITKFSDIGANSNNPDIIKDHITDAYYNWEHPPTYVLIVGDDGVFPKKIVNYGYSFPNEDFFVEIEGNDFFPEMMIGRFTNQGDYRLQVMVNKFIMYEKYPYTADTSWFKKGIVCSNNAYESQIYTKRFTAEVMKVDGQFTHVDTLMSDGTWGNPCSMDLDDVIDAIDEGRSYLNYRGEGWSSGWWADCYPFSTSDVSTLNNDEKFTFVTSIGCGVGMFDTGGGNCFGEEWLQLGSLTEPRGACAFIGPTSNTHTTYNNKLDKGIYVGMFQEGMDTPGQALLRGKLYVYNVFGTDPNVEYQYRVYCILGDPSMHIWKDIPLAVNVEYESTIIVGNNNLEFDITFASSGQPVKNAQVCLVGNEIFETVWSDSTGKAIIEFSPELEETLSVTIRGGNVYPFQGLLEVIHPQELVEIEGEPSMDDLDGNMDGLINPNENGVVSFTLKNWGSLVAGNVQATLSTTDTNLQIITTEAISFGDIGPNEEATGGPFQFYVKQFCPVGHLLPLQLHVSSNTTSWDYTYNAEVSGCKLIYENFVVFDEYATTMNYRLDPGETGLLILSINNIGDDFANAVMGTITSDDPYITIMAEEGYFGSVDVNGNAISTDYHVSVDASCPAEYLAEMSVVLITQNGNYPYQTTETFNLPIGLSMTNDFTGPDEYGYYAYASNDKFYDQTPVYNWVEIEEVGTQLMVPGVSEYTETVNLPFPFKYYGVEYNHLRISTDGWIAFNGGQQIAPENTALPNDDNVNNMAAVFWDDLFEVTYTGEGDIYYYHDNDNHRFIVQWDSISHNGFISEPQKEVFQAILLDPAFNQTSTGDGEIIFQYKNLEEITSNTIGIENNTQDVGLQYVFNDNYDQTASELVNEIAIKFTTESPNVAVVVSVDENLSDNDNSASGSLEQNYPNPFKSNTWINYSLANKSDVKLMIYNQKGELVYTYQADKQNAGNYSVEWIGANNNGNAVESGVYFYRLQTEFFVDTKKMLMLK
jgi:hypothetical protein